MATMNYFFQHQLSPAVQIRTGNFVELFNVKTILLNRGFEDISEGSIDDTLFSIEANNIFDLSSRHTAKPRWEFINLFNQKEVRKQIKQMIYDGIVPSSIVLNDFHFKSSKLNQQRFTKTLELLLAYLAIEELKALSASFGIKMKNCPHGGDFDCIANFQNELVYFEAKSGNISNIHINTIQSFFDRHYFLAPYASILFLDYEGGDNKLDHLISQFKGRNIGKRPIEEVRKILQGTKKLYVVESDVIIMDIHNDGNILSNLRFAVQYIHRYNAFQKNMMHNLIRPEYLGYDSIVL